MKLTYFMFCIHFYVLLELCIKTYYHYTVSNLNIYSMYSIEELVNNELNDLFFSYSYSEVSISDKSKEQIVNSVIYNIQRITGSYVSKETIDKINSILDVQVVNVQYSEF